MNIGRCFCEILDYHQHINRHHIGIVFDTDTVYKVCLFEMIYLN